jgi:Tfp pilus assembly protein PilX
MKNNITNIKNQRGVAIIWTLMFSMIFLTIVTTLVLLVVKELRITSNIDQSNRAYLAAEAGMERSLAKLNQETNADINWCGIITYSGVPVVSGVVYNANINCTGSGPSRVITIESEGVDSGSIRRKLKTVITYVSPTDKIEKFDNSATRPPLSDGGYYAFNNTSGVADDAFIMQQFDISRLNSAPADRSITVGIAGSGKVTSPTNFGIRLIPRGSVGSSRSVDITLVGSVGGALLSPVGPYSVSMNSNVYRVKLEYARQGFYTVVRAIVLKQTPLGVGGEDFVCIDASKSYVVYSGIALNGLNPEWVRVDGSLGENYSDELGNGFILMNGGGGARVDNMVFWGKN